MADRDSSAARNHGSTRVKWLPLLLAIAIGLALYFHARAARLDPRRPNRAGHHCLHHRAVGFRRDEQRRRVRS